MTLRKKPFMRSLTSCSNRALSAVVLLLAGLAGCAHVPENPAVRATPVRSGLRLAVLPVYNLTGKGGAPAGEMRQSLQNKLRAAGLQVVEENDLEKLLARYRVRYTGGVDAKTALALKDELKADAILLTSLEGYGEGFPPNINVTSRLVSAEGRPRVLWIESVNRRGDDSPGFLGLKVVDKYSKLQDMAVDTLVSSLQDHLSGTGSRFSPRDSDKRFKPKHIYASRDYARPLYPIVAAVPFINKSQRTRAGEIEMLHFIRELSRLPNFEVLEPGIIRNQMLNIRYVTSDGPSLQHLDLLAIPLGVDLVLYGTVFDYDQDYQRTPGLPMVDFSALVVERTNRRIIGAAKSYNKGDDGVYFFDLGKISTAGQLTSKMIQCIMTDFARSGFVGGGNLPGSAPGSLPSRRKAAFVAMEGEARGQIPP
jgi:hypothetical protein